MRNSNKYMNINEMFESIINESSISIDKKVTNIINSRDFKKFVNYFNSFYGKNGVYSSGKDIAEKDIIKGLYNVFKRNKKYEWGDGDSVDREFVRDELFKMKVLSDKIYKNESVNEYNVNKKFGSKYDIGAGQFPTGTVFWNRAENENGDYKKLAHVADNGKITFYDKSLPSNVKKHIEDYAKTQTESVNEANNPKFKKGDKVIVKNPHGNDFKGVVEFPKLDVKIKGIETLVSLKGAGGVWDSKYLTLAESVNEAKFGYTDSTASYINKHNNEYKIAEKMNKGNEQKFYDELETLEDKIGRPKTMVFISNALRGYGVDMYKDPKIKTPADAQEALFLLSR